jgi:hypothetical protein
MWNIIGKITVLLCDFNAITISEIAGLDDEIFLGYPGLNSSNSTLNMTHSTTNKTNLTRPA